MSKKSKILIVDDEKNARDGLRRALSYRYDIDVADCAETALQLVGQTDYDVILTDLRMPGMDGMQFTQEVHRISAKTLIILLTAYGSIQTAIEAMKSGAYDYLTKPINLDHLEMVIERGLKERESINENEKLRELDAPDSPFRNIIGNSPQMQDIFEKIGQVADTKTTILLTGESGTGKELVAKAIHLASGRKKSPFVTVHCAALNESLLESELFGHEKGAFTGAVERHIGRFERANGGTLFLDEIGEINSALQIKLLRVLETRNFERVGGTETIESNVRLITATNRNLKEEVEAGRFREDLYYRLNVVNMHLPSLRERENDIPLLLTHYLTLFCDENGKKIDGFTPEALKLLMAYSWPGNVRELRNCVERMVVMARGSTLSMQDIPKEIQEEIGERLQSEQPQDNGTEVDEVADVSLATNERRLIEKALERCHGNRSEAAKQLGMSRRTLYRRLEEYGLK